jgi:predicted GNAT family N-acyltransferase
MSSPLNIETLAKHHDRSSFSCGIIELDRYLKEQASQDQKRKTSSVFIATQNKKTVGFFTLSATSISRESLPNEVIKKLPKYPIPAVLLGRLAVDKTAHGKGFGQILLVNAMKRALIASEAVGMYALVVDAKNNSAKSFYKHFGFIEFTDFPMRLFIPLDTISNLFN